MPGRPVEDTSTRAVTLVGMQRAFRQVDVFTATPYRGNPVAVVLDGEGLSAEEMQRFAHWTNLSETTFVLPPTSRDADYRVRIFTPVAELPFAGHPTLGTCHAWRSAGGARDRDVVVQECAAGLVPVRRTEAGLAFAAPPLLRTGPVEPSLVARIASGLGIEPGEVVDAQWAVNGPEWIAVLLESADAVLALRPGLLDLDVGVAGPYPEGSPHAFEVRAFFPKDGATVEDPVTGSLNASLAQWLLGTGRARAPYVASQGTALGRAGRVHVSRDPDGTIWVGGGTVTCIAGEVEL
jgi:PhzF family phenazine biosynthesis protein